jgi:hypothetical protein
MLFRVWPDCSPRHGTHGGRRTAKVIQFLPHAHSAVPSRDNAGGKSFPEKGSQAVYRSAFDD